jgi:hypothetical protein
MISRLLGYLTERSSYIDKQYARRLKRKLALVQAETAQIEAKTAEDKAKLAEIKSNIIEAIKKNATLKSKLTAEELRELGL